MKTHIFVTLLSRKAHVPLLFMILYVLAGCSDQLDLSFGPDGRQTTDLSMLDDVGHDVAIQDDRKIVVVGESSRTNAPLFKDFGVVRYNVDGTLDTSFRSNGKVITSFGSGSNIAFAVAIQADDKIIAAGLCSAGGFGLARYNTDGSLDTTFNADGRVCRNEVGSNGNPDEEAYAVAIQADGKIVLAGTNGAHVVVLRFSPDGGTDSTFGTGGIVRTTDADVAYSVAIQGDGKIVVAGYKDTGGAKDLAVLRYNSNGDLDTSFDTDGIVTTDLGATDELAKGVVIQADGKIVVAGYTDNGQDDDFAVVRYNTDGSLDTSFDSDGIVTTDFDATFDQANDIALSQIEQKIVVAGTSRSHFAMVRYNTDGSLDTSFDFNGRFTGGSGAANALAIEPAIDVLPTPVPGKIVLAGHSATGFGHDFTVERYHP